MKDPYDGCDNANAGHEEAGDLVEVGAVILSRREGRDGYNQGTSILLIGTAIRPKNIPLTSFTPWRVHVT